MREESERKIKSACSAGISNEMRHTLRCEISSSWYNDNKMQFCYWFLAICQRTNEERERERNGQKTTIKQKKKF